MLQDKDTNQGFTKIQKFASKFELGRSNGASWKRLTLHANDNSKVSFMVQMPCHRQTRREDKVMQVLRTFNGYDINYSTGAVILDEGIQCSTTEERDTKTQPFFPLTSRSLL